MNIACLLWFCKPILLELFSCKTKSNDDHLEVWLPDSMLLSDLIGLWFSMKITLIIYDQYILNLYATLLLRLCAIIKPNLFRLVAMQCSTWAATNTCLNWNGCWSAQDTWPEVVQWIFKAGGQGHGTWHWPLPCIQFQHS